MTDPAVFLQEFARARAERVVDTPGGFAVLSPTGFPHAHDHNALWVTGAVDPVALLAAADDVLGGLGHRRIEVDPPRDDLAGPLAAAGYAREDDVVMTWVREPEAARASAAGVCVLTVEQRIEVAVRVWDELDAAMPPAVHRELASRVRTAATAARCTFLGVLGDAGDVVAHCDLYVRDDTAQVEEVYTLAGFRGRGHASRLVRAAATRARADDPDRRVFLVAEADDWPKDLYARLGFEVTGRRTVWSRVLSDR